MNTNNPARSGALRALRIASATPKVFASGLVSLVVAMTALAISARAEFVRVGDLTDARAAHTATLLNDGRVLFAGGFGAGMGHLASTELYSPGPRTFSPGPVMSTVRVYHSATALLDGRVLLLGGHEGLATAELFDPATNTLRVIAGPPEFKLMQHCATRLANGIVLIAGGQANNATVGRAYLFDPITEQFSATGSLVQPRMGGLDVLLQDGRVLVAGGSTFGSPNQMNSAEIYDPATGQFTLLTSAMAVGRQRQAGENTPVRLANGDVLLSGGMSFDTGYAAELFQAATGTFASAAVPTYFAGTGNSLTLLADGRALQIGGFNWGPMTAAADASLYDPAAQFFSAAGAMIGPRFVHTATLLLDGSVLIAGGRPNVSEPTPLATAELFTLTVPDTIPPEITQLSVSPSVLWPPNHRMVPVTVTAVATDNVAVTSLGIVSIASNEPDNGQGDGDTVGDIEITGALTANLRAERSGRGNGRIYTITVEAADAAGNRTSRTVTVSVPKNQRGK